jgi:hypothetical protein
MTTLLDEIRAKCPPELIASKEHGEIARIVSIGRTRPSSREIGNGTILEVLGLAAGNVKPLVEQGRLIVGSPLVAQSLGAFVAGNVITQADADKLLAIAVEPAPVSVGEVVKAMEG